MESSKIVTLLFPALAAHRFAEVDLDREARAAGKRYAAVHGRSPLLDPAACQAFIDELHARLGVRHSWGGYLEDRSFLWAGSYMENGRKFLHLGVDLNVPAGTEVAVPFGGRVRVVDDDRDTEGGWGPRVIVEPKSGGSAAPLLIFAHLCDVGVAPGDELPAGSVIGRVGAPPDNGNWFPHLHVQAVERGEFSRLASSDLSELDGYAQVTQREPMRTLYPDPLLTMASLL